MGNTESSSQSHNNEEEEEERKTSSSALKIGAAVAAGSALLALGAYTLAFQPIKIMTYNVWIHEDVWVHKRMEAIGQLIEKHSPDIILFQEVTPNIYGIFEDSNWMKIYGYCSPIKATTSSFCMLVSKLHVEEEEFFCVPFENSRPEKELCYAEITAGANMKLLAATSHFKRLDQRERNCEERMAQAKQALRLLDPWPNVIFGGDLNWVEKFDGDLPLPRGWQDAWPSLRPGEDGWTYDRKSNEMVLGKLQKRPDRFLCKLQEFKMVDVQIIGTDPIPGISHYNNKGEKVRVWPSDHYGLVLTIRRI